MYLDRRVEHPHLGSGRLLKTYAGGHEWEVLFDSGRRYRLPAHEFRDYAAPIPAAPPPGAAAARFAPPLARMPTPQFRARQTVETLRLGIVPVQDVESFTIGLETQTLSLERALARSREQSGDVQAVIGDYGYGKSHFVELAARRALRENFVVASTSLDLVEVPPGRPYEIYRALIGALRYPDSPERGLKWLLQKALQSPSAVRALQEQSPVPHCPLTLTLSALANPANQWVYTGLVHWVGGQIKNNALVRAALKKVPGVSRPPTLYVTGEVGRQYAYLLSAISTLASLVGYSGLAVLVDESEHYSLLKANQRERADSFFQAMICAAMGPANSRINPAHIPEDHRASYPVSFSATPHLFFLFALTESENRMPVDDWLAPAQIIGLDDRFIEKDIQRFFGSLVDCHSLAYGYPTDNGRYAQVRATAPGILARLLGQHRVNLREMIRTAVTLCDLLYLYGDDPPQMALDELSRGLHM